MKHHFLIDGVRHRAWLAHSAEGHALLDNVISDVSLESQSDSRARLRVDKHTYEISIAVAGDRVFLHLGGCDYEVAYEAATAVFEHEAESTSDAVSRAPMPGSVVATPVAAGKIVAEGDVLIVIESMKLETSITATRAGIVETVHVALGQTFDRDAHLVTLAPLVEN